MAVQNEGGQIYLEAIKHSPLTEAAGKVFAVLTAVSKNA